MGNRALVPEYLLHKVATGQADGEFAGGAIFVDISGFTEMTATLATHGKKGAEVLSRTINRVFGSAVETVYEVGGFVASFAGDAFTALFPDMGLVETVEPALRIAGIFDQHYVQPTPYGEFTLEMKIGLAEGVVQWGVVRQGDQLAGYFRGSVIDEAARAEHQARPGDIVLAAEGAPLVSRSYRTESISSSHVKLVRSESGTAAAKPSASSRLQSPIPGTSLSESDMTVQRRFVPEALLDSTLPGEFRRVASVFVSFADPADRSAIADLVEPILRAARDYGGLFDLLDFGDKGGMILVVFGAPRLLGNMAERVTGFVEEVLERSARRVRIGFTIGTAFAGFVGSTGRGTYTVLGPPVNLAARIAVAAELGTAQTAGAGAESLPFRLRRIATRRFKGFSEPIEIHQLIIGAGPGESTLPAPRLYGREEEIRAIQVWLGKLEEGVSPKRLVISGEAGAGKTALAMAAFTGLSEGVTVVQLQTDTILRKSLNVFKGLIEWCFRTAGMLPPSPADQEASGSMRLLLERLSASAGNQAQLDSATPALLSLLGVVSDDPSFGGLDAQARFESVISALVLLLQALSRKRPVVLVVDDAHAIDSDSLTAVGRILRVHTEMPIGVVFLARSVDATPLSQFVSDGEDPVARIQLGVLAINAVARIVADEIHGPVASELVDFVIRRIGTNPFYVKELASYLGRHDLLRRGNQGYSLVASDVPLPEGIASLLLTRLDSLAAEVQAVARVAALMGSEFRIHEVALVLGKSQVDAAMGSPDANMLWDDAGQGVMRFRQELMRETIENTQLETSLAAAHGRIAEALSKYAGNDPARYADLAHHFDRAGRVSESRRYLKLAADYAATNFKNDKAVEFYTRFIQVTQTTKERITAYGALAEVQKVVGNWKESENALVYAIGLSVITRDVRSRIQLMSKLGAVLQRLGNGAEAVGVLGTAVALARRFGDRTLLAEALIEHGRALLERGDYVRATETLEAARKEANIAGESREEGLALYYRGVIFRDQNRYDDALRCYRKARSRFQVAKDDRLLTYPLYDMGIVHQYTGDTDEARRCFTEVIGVYERIGYQSGKAAAVLNLGVLEDRKGDFESAQRYFSHSREIADTIGERLASAYALFSMGATAYKAHDFRKALYYLKTSYQMFKALAARGYYGYPLSYLVCVYADNGDIDSAIRVCFVHLRNVQAIGSDVENGRAYLGLALALSIDKPMSHAAESLLRRIARHEKIVEPVPESFFRLAIASASRSGYVNTLIPAHHQYGHYLLGLKRKREADEQLLQAYRHALRSKWERFVATFESDYRSLVARSRGMPDHSAATHGTVVGSETAPARQENSDPEERRR